MTNVILHPDQLIAFHKADVSMETALKYAHQMENAKTPFITVEKLNNEEKYNVIGGFKYLDGIRLLQKDLELLCNIVEPFADEINRKLAILQRCLVHQEKIIYKEVLIQELMKEHRMHELEISAKLGQEAKKIQKYMYKQIIPETYFDDADEQALKPLVQSIYLANKFPPFEKRLLTELSLYAPEEYRFKRKHFGLYKQYRQKYKLYTDFLEAEKQVMQVIHLDEVNKKYWASIPHPDEFHLTKDDDLFGDEEMMH